MYFSGFFVVEEEEDVLFLGGEFEAKIFSAGILKVG
jgi:hypothetical protein